jgi:hypothetical protein
MTLSEAFSTAEAWRKRNWRWFRWVTVAAVALLIGAVFL